MTNQCAGTIYRMLPGEKYRTESQKSLMSEDVTPVVAKYGFSQTGRATDFILLGLILRTIAWFVFSLTSPPHF